MDQEGIRVSHPNLDIEHEIFMLFRRTFAIHVQTSSGDYELDRSTYGILLLLDDEGRVAGWTAPFSRVLVRYGTLPKDLSLDSWTTAVYGQSDGDGGK